MSNQNTTTSRINFASRLLSKAMSERKDSGKFQKPTTADVAQFEPRDTVKIKEPVGSAK